LRVTGIPASGVPTAACCGDLVRDTGEFDTEVFAGCTESGAVESVFLGLAARSFKSIVQAPLRLPECGARGLAYGDLADGRRLVSFRDGDVVLSEIDVLDVVAGV
jgi:hypothetical protein